MYRKEFKECGRKAANTLLLLVIIPVFYLFDRLFLDLRLDYSIVAKLGLGFVISIIALMFTVSMFHAEQQDHAMEYLLSLPVSRYSIIGFKLIPRFALLTLLYIVYIIIQPLKGSIIGDDPSIFIHPFVLPMVIFEFLILGFIIGLMGSKSVFMKVFTIISFYAVVGGTAGLAANFIDINRDTFNVDGWGPFFWISSTIMLLIWWVSFSPVFRRFDLRGGGFHFKRFAWLAVPLLAVYIFVILASLFIENWVKNWIPIFWIGATIIIFFWWVRFSLLFKKSIKE
jgi:hypothetical protein